MYFILYVSTAGNRMSEQELVDILKVSLRNNEARGVTGMLLYKEGERFGIGSFMQLLEGDQAVVTEIYDRIVEDKRHHTIVPLESGDIEARSFPDWSMGFRTVNAEDLARIPGFADLGDQSFQDPGFTNNPGDVLALMRAFYEEDD